MHETKGSRPLARDADGKALMTLEELKEGMFQSIRDNGTVELIRAQLRRQFIEKLQQQRRLSASRDEENDAGQANQNTRSASPCEKLVNGLILEYLKSKGLENTLAVFVPESGGSHNQVDKATVFQLLRVSSKLQDQFKHEQDNTGQALLLVLVRELMRRFQLATMDSGTQTATDCRDHRIVLENELRRVETSYLTACAAQHVAPQKSLEERMIHYQREYDDICNQRLQEEIERFKALESERIRTDERKRYTSTLNTLQTTLLHESRTKQERLQERERDLELAFVARRTELETSLFETRQSLFQRIESVRVKEAELQVKVERDFRHFASETQRFQAWEENVRTQEGNLEGMIAQAMREKERAWRLERQQTVSDLETKQEALAQRERALANETETLKTLTDQVGGLQQKVTALETALWKSNDELQSAQKSAVQLNLDRQQLADHVAELKTQVCDLQTKDANEILTNTRLVANATVTNDKLIHIKQKCVELKKHLEIARTEIQSLQQQKLEMKLSEASGIVAERTKFMRLMDEERERSQWKENELMVKNRETARQLAEAEVLAEKVQSQYENEKVQVVALRHEISSLHSLLTQAQATITVKHGHSREPPSVRGVRGLRSTDSFRNSQWSDWNQRPQGSEALLHRPMITPLPEQSNMLQNWGDVIGNHQVALALRMQQKSVGHVMMAMDQDQEERKQGEGRMEQENSDQRELRNMQVQIEEKEKEMAMQQRFADEKLARLCEERKEKERLEERRHQILLEGRNVNVESTRQGDEKEAEKLMQRRLVDENEKKKELRKEKTNLEYVQEECEIEHRANEMVVRECEEREAEEKRLRYERYRQEEQTRIREEQELVALRHEAERRREEEIRLIEEEKKCVEAEVAERAKSKAEIEASREEFSIKDDDNGVHSLYSSAVEDSATIENADKRATNEGQEKETLSEEIQGVDESINNIQGDDIDPDSIHGSAVEDSATIGIPEEKATNNVCENETLAKEIQVTADRIESLQSDGDVESDVLKHPLEPSMPPLIQETAEEATKKEDESIIDVYRQRVLARKAAEKQRQLELEADAERKAKEEQTHQLLLNGSDSDEELELSGGSFAESSAASNSGSF